ncbi:MAG: amidohydrolase family protein, partial [Solobacterium sp.]|nr:amidohydrolase family protein [Solobacterium sp.]
MDSHRRRHHQGDRRHRDSGRGKVVDFKGNYVSPGLFNCHVHTVLDTGKAADGRPLITAATIEGIENLQKYLRSGVTYVRDVGGSNFIDIDLRDAVKAGQVDGPEMVVSGKCICMTGGHGWTGGREADGPDDARKAAREQLRAGADWIKVMATGGVMTKGVEPGSPQLTE